MRVLVTGITGFAGGHLTEALLGRGPVELFGVSRRAEWPAEWRHLVRRAILTSCDLCDATACRGLIRAVQPGEIYHLAGYANAGRSLQEPEAAWSGNLTATLNLYDAIEHWGGRPRVLYVGSGLIYGDVDGTHPALDENCPLRPVNPYAASKAAADLASYQHARFPGLDIVRVRPFNHIGPRQAPHYAVAHFAKQIAAIEQGLQPPYLETGSLTAQRDLTDVRDTVAAYLLLMEKGRTGEAYNVATGEAHPMQAVLDRLLAMARVRVEVRQQPQLLRAAESSAVMGDAGMLRRETGWRPQYSLDRTLADILDYWRDSVARGWHSLSA
jgi:GDP-4-dehydro-6-deoxy-D-mannose reductase